MRSLVLALSLISLAPAALVACSGNAHKTTQGHTIAPVAPPTLDDAAPRNYAGLHNVVAYHDGYYSGSVPEGPEGFETLAAMGVKTIISVDGAVPDVAHAKALGLRYIHLPIGYNGFDESRKLELVRATRDAMTDGPVYIHCHHGKHRSAGAAATIAASLGWLTPDAAVARMKVSGTAPGYKGLYTCASTATPLDAAKIDAIPANFPAISRPGSFVAAMVEMDEVSEHLKAIEKAGWKSPADHPDLVPVAEAGRLADLLRLAAAGDRARRQDAGFALALTHNSDAAQSLEDMLAALETDPAKLTAQFSLVQKSCKACHEKYRD